MAKVAILAISPKTSISPCKNRSALSALFALLMVKVQKVQIVQCKNLHEILEIVEIVRWKVSHVIFGGNGTFAPCRGHNLLAHRNREHRTPRLRNTAGNRTPKSANGEKILPNGTTGISFRTMDDVTGIRFRAN